MKILNQHRSCILNCGDMYINKKYGDTGFYIMMKTESDNLDLIVGEYDTEEKAKIQLEDIFDALKYGLQYYKVK